jgi:hypothetical protein
VIGFCGDEYFMSITIRNFVNSQIPIIYTELQYCALLMDCNKILAKTCVLCDLLFCLLCMGLTVISFLISGWF